MSAGSPRILVVDDNRELADNLAEILEDADYDTAVAYSGPQALALARGHRFDAVLADIRMPGMNGVELVQQLQAMNLDTIYVLMTAYASDVILSEAVKSGVRAILHKPFEVPLLLRALPRGASSVLLVEDDRPFAEVLVDALTRRGYRIRAADRPARALEAIDVERPDAVIVDLDGDEDDGVALARDLVARQVPVVLVGCDGHGLEIQAIAGALPRASVRYLVKPFDTESLLTALRALLPSREAAS